MRGPDLALAPQFRQPLKDTFRADTGSTLQKTGSGSNILDHRVGPIPNLHTHSTPNRPPVTGFQLTRPRQHTISPPLTDQTLPGCRSPSFTSTAAPDTVPATCFAPLRPAIQPP